MDIKYLANILEQIRRKNHRIKFVLSVANNHTFDTSDRSSEDIHGLAQTVRVIKERFPHDEVIGTDVGGAKQFLTHKLEEGGPSIGIVAWTDVMNHDGLHFRKPVVRGKDLTHDALSKMKYKVPFLIGFAHGNEEQAYHPVQKTRRRWLSMIKPEAGFDLVVGHGPHTVQRTEAVAGGGLLINSIGNFCSPSGGWQTKFGSIPVVTLSYDGNQITSADYRINYLEQVDQEITLFRHNKQPPQERSKDYQPPLLDAEVSSVRRKWFERRLATI